MSDKPSEGELFPSMVNDFFVTRGLYGALELFIFRNNKTSNIYEKYHDIPYINHSFRNKEHRAWRFIGGA